MTPSADAVETLYGDLWYERGLKGEKIPMYVNETAELAAISAFMDGDFGSLTSVEIKFMKETIKEYPL